MKASNIVRRLVCVALVAAVWGSAQVAGAQPGPPGGPPSGVLSGFGLQAILQFAGNVADFPAISTTPGLTFRYDPQTQLFERASTALGPVFVERALTIGRGKFEFGTSYLFIDYKTLNGDDVEDFGGQAARLPNASLDIVKFDLETHIIPLYATYGITDRWDVNLLMPLIATSFDGRVRLKVGPLNLNFAESSDDFGVGDLFLRTKYRLFGFNGFNVAAGSTVRFPTGEEEKLRGKGDYILEPFLAISQEYDRFDFHLAGGVQVNFDDSDRSRASYSLGVAANLIEQLALTADLIGNSSLKTDQIVGEIPGLGPAGSQRVTTPLNTDIIDVAVGLKGNIGRVTGYVTFFVPVTNDGLRADFIPAGGFQLSF